MRSLSIISMGLLAASCAFAGPRVIGNGGDAVICVGQNGSKTAELLDYYEARTMRGINVDLGPASLGVKEKIQIALDRLAQISPLRAQAYKKEADLFHQKAKFVYNTTLPDIPDSQHVIIPSHCKLAQLVIQRPVGTPADEPKYIVDGDIWKLLDNTQQAGIILHEVIYMEALSAGAENSIGTRYLNSRISSSLANLDTEEKKLTLFRQVGLVKGESKGLVFNLRGADTYYQELLGWGPVQFYKNGSLERAYTSGVHKLRIGKRDFENNRSGYLGFYEGGSILEGTFEQTTVVVGGLSYSIGGHYSNQNPDLMFYPNGDIKGIYVFKTMKVPIQGALVACSLMVEFNHNETVKSCLNVETFKAQSSQGFKVKCNYGDITPPGPVAFTATGLVDMSDKATQQICKKTLF